MKDLLSIAEIAERLGLSPGTIRAMIRRGVLPAVKLYPRGRQTKRPTLRVHAARLAALLDGGSPPLVPTAEDVRRDVLLATDRRARRRQSERAARRSAGTS